MPNNHTHIILFDGECNLCNKFVDTVIRVDKQHKFRFDSLQSNKSKQALASFGMNPENLGTVIYMRDGKLYKKSDAALLISKDLGFPFYLAITFWIIPKFIRDRVYNYIAQNRYTWFGKRNSCRIPTQEESAKFL